MLRSAREAKSISLEEVEKATKIRKKFLEAIESDDYTVIPSIAYAKGFIKNYSEYLGMDSEVALAFFRRQTQDAPKQTLLPKKTTVEKDSWFRLTPGRFLMLLLVGCVVVFFSYFFFQYRNLYRAPYLTVDKPKQETIVEVRNVDVLGKTDSDATVTVNGVSVMVRSDGQFFDQIALEPGVNTLVITATSRFGKETTIVRKVGLKQ